MAQGLTFYVNNTAPSLIMTLKRGWHPIDLTGAIVYFQMMPCGGDSLVINNACVILEPVLSGQARYDWRAGDLATIGNYLCNAYIVYSDGRTESSETTLLFVVDTIPPVSS